MSCLPSSWGGGGSRLRLLDTAHSRSPETLELEANGGDVGSDWRFSLAAERHVVLVGADCAGGIGGEKGKASLFAKELRKAVRSLHVKNDRPTTDGSECARWLAGALQESGNAERGDGA